MTRRVHSRFHDVTVAIIGAAAVLWILVIAYWLRDDDSNTDSEPSTRPTAPTDLERIAASGRDSRSQVRTTPPSPMPPTSPKVSATSTETVRASSTPTATTSTRKRGSGGGVPWPWNALAACESSGDPQAVSPGGTYRGLFQFSVPTWLSVGGSGDPAAATVAEQLRRARILQARSGFGQWPQCAAQLGLN